MDSIDTSQEKALQINSEGLRYGTIAEIGAGQEVARWFFRAGKASSTIAKSASAYDMAVSDAVYGPAPRYVSRDRLCAMLDHEYNQIIDRLAAKRGERNAFFAYADTIATHGSSRSAGGHGWLGIRFQEHPGTEPSQIILHIELLDSHSTNQQEAVGIAGVNLIYGAFTFSRDPVQLIRSLMDGLDRRRIEIDLIKFSGPAFQGVDNRLMSLQLVELGLADVAMFTADGEVVQPSEVLYNRAVLIERGSFRPVTNVTLEMLESSLRQLREETVPPPQQSVVLMEMTLYNLMSGPAIDHQDFLARADTLAALGKTVMISRYTRFDLVTTYLRHYTSNRIAMVIGIPTLHAIFEEQYYQDLEGGILEGLGRLFSGKVKLIAYPALSESGKLETAADMAIEPKLQHLYAYLFENGFIEPVREYATEQLALSPGDVLKRIQSGDPSWREFVPAAAADVIERKQLFRNAIA